MVAADIPPDSVSDSPFDEVADHAVTLLLAAWRRLVPIPASGTAQRPPASGH